MMMEFVTRAVDQLHELCEAGVELSFVAGFTAGLLAIVVLILNVVARRWLSAAQMAALWSLVLLRMLIPIAPGSSLSVQNAVIDVRSLLPTSEFPLKFAPSPNQAARSGENSAQAAIAYSDTIVRRPARRAQPALSDRAINGIPFIWGAGVFVVMTGGLVRHWRFCLRVSRAASSSDPRLTALCEQAARELGMRRTPRMVVFDEVAQPAVMGFLWPQVLLPSSLADLGDRQMRMVLLHELVHVKRFDTAAGWLLLIVRACQWWNPAFWLASARYLHLREQACDAGVIRRLNNEELGRRAGVRDYSELLLTLASRVEERGWRVNMPASLLGFVKSTFQKRAVSNRLRAIHRSLRPRTRLQAGVAMAAIATIAIGGFTDAVEIRPTPRKAAPCRWWPSHVQFRDGSASLAVAHGEWKEKRYDVTAAIRRIAAVDRVTTEEAVVRCRSALRELVNRSPGETNDAGSTDVANADLPSATVTITPADEGWQLDLWAPESEQASAQRALQAWAIGGLRQIVVEAWIANAKRDLAESVGIEWTSLLRASTDGSAGSPNDSVSTHHAADNAPFVSATSVLEVTTPVLISQINAEERRRFVEVAQSDERSNVFWAPKTTLFNAQRAHLASVVRRPFVTAVEFLDDGSSQPQIELFDDGLRVMLEPQVAADGDASNLVSRWEFSNIVDVFTMTANLRGQEVAVQTPTVSSCRIDISATVPHGESLLVCVPPAHNRTNYTFVLLRPTPLPAGSGSGQ